MDKNYLHEIEVASRDEINALQEKRLKKVLSKVYKKVVYYKKKFDDHGVHPDDFKRLEDLNKFPFTTKEDLRLNYPFNLFAENMDQVVRIHASSGTTGKPTVVGYTANDIRNWADVVARSIYASGGRAGDMVHISYGYGLFTGGLGAHYGAEKLGCTVIPVSGGNTEKQIQIIEDFKPKIIMVTPSYVLNIIEVMEKMKKNPQSSSLKIGIFGAEPWSNEIRKNIEKKLSIDAIDIYGLSEIVGPGVANECIEEKGSLYIWEDHFYPEIIDAENQKVLPDGGKGELVFTSLTKEAMPLIRYRTNDLTTLYPGRVRSMRRIDKILGRKDDMLVIRGVNVFPSQIEEILLRFKEISSIYQLEVTTRDTLMHHLTVHFELNPNPNNNVDVIQLKKQVAEKIKDNIGISTEINIKALGEIPRSQGKAQRVVFNQSS